MFILKHAKANSRVSEAFFCRHRQETQTHKIKLSIFKHAKTKLVLSSINHFPKLKKEKRNHD